MNILGLSCLAPSGVVHDVSTALLIDGKISTSVSEDRFTGIKHYNGYPAMGIKYSLEKEGIRVSDIDNISVGYGLLDDVKKINDKNFFSHAKIDNSFRLTPLEKKNPKFYDHEYIHAKTGYFLSGFKNAVVISLDGGGVDKGGVVSGGIFVIKNGETELIKLYPISASLGWTYGAFTELCGFRMVDGEGKTMSLATFAQNESEQTKQEIYEKISKIFPKYSGIDYLEGGLENPKWKLLHNSGFARFDDSQLLSLKEHYKTELIAWGAQKVLEDTIVNIALSAIQETGQKNVIFTGGVFFNMIANMIIREKLEQKDYHVFFNPICGDMGNALGVALEENFQQTGDFQNNDWISLSLGPEYDDKQIESALLRNNLSYNKVEKVSTAIDLIDKGKCVGWFQGKAELGPRGLGNRSILSRVDDVKYKDTMNEKVKHRESWRPFCPTITENRSDYFLQNNTYAPYMIMGFRMKHTEEAPAIAHIDQTTRPQTLRKSSNNDFYEVVDGMGGIVLNTSLNLAGDPTNLNPEQAILSFKYSQMDALIIGDYLVKR